MCVYAGFNKVAGFFGTLNEIFKQSSVVTSKAAMISTSKKADYALRDEKGKVTFYVLLWKRKGITLELFDNYWKNVHGPVCARLPGQYQYWQFHLSHNEGGLWPTINGIDFTCPEEDQFDGIAELTFETEADRETWFKSAAILMDDEHNLFSKAIGYTTSPGNSTTYVDGIKTGDPNGELDILKFHAMVKKADAVSVDEFRKYMTDSFAPSVAQSDLVLKFRLHLFEAVDNSRPDAAGVSHYEPPEKQYQAAFEIAFSNHLEMEKFFASKEYAAAVENQTKYVKQINPFPERTTNTFVYNGQMTLAGERSSRVAELITKLGANNQLEENIVALMSGKQKQNGEALESHKAASKVTKDLTATQEQHKMTNQTSSSVVDAKAPHLMSEKVYATFSSPANADRSTVWHVMLDEIENPQRYNPGVQDYKILERYNNGVLRQRKVLNLTIKEIITWDEETREIRHILADNPLFIGEAVKRIDHEDNNFNGHQRVTYTVDWKPYTQEARKVAQEIQGNIAQAVEQVVIKTVSVAEQEDAQNQLQFAVSNSQLNGSQPVTEKLPGTTSDMVKRLFSMGEAFDSEGFANFFTDTPVYQFGNFEPCLTKADIKKSTDVFFSQISAVYHDIKMLWEIGDVVFVEMDVTYWRKDGSVVTLPCADIFRVQGDKFSELRIFMDANPVGDSSIPVPATSSVLTGSQGKRLTSPEIMKKHFAEHPDAKKRIEMGLVPKWSVAGPKWSIDKPGTVVAAEPVTEKLPGTTSDMVKRLFSMGEAFDSEGFANFFTDTPVYQFGNFEPCLTKADIKKSTDVFFSQISAVYHDIKMLWEIGDVVFVEMDVTYWRKDGSVVTLPCADIFRVQGDKFSELRIFMDANPVGDSSIPVPATSSVLTGSQGKKLTSPDIMKKHFAEHPDAKKRIEMGLVPRWSVAGPKWSIDE